jgi:3-deoxy-D-manno-octulosonic-acid transferase
LSPMYLVYNILLTITSVFLSPFLCFMLLIRPKYRKGLIQKLGFLPGKDLVSLEGKQPIWIHAVSVGEVMAAIPLIRELKKKYPEEKLVISTVTDTGNYTARQQVKEADSVIFFPFDYPGIVRKVITRVRPRLFITLETEIWPNFLRELNRLKIPAIMVSGRISSNSYRQYRFFSFFFKRVLENISFFCMQSETDASRIAAIGARPERLRITGNLKLNQNIPIRIPEDKKGLFLSLNLREGQNIFIAGSTHRGEEEIILAVFRELKKEFPDLILLLAPRHPERFSEVASLLQGMEFNSIRRTEISPSSGGRGAIEVILLDTIGELFKFYGIGTVIFIGGSLVPIGGHNILEPAIYKKAVLFGPHMDNFSDISQILSSTGAGICVGNEKELLTRARALLLDEGLRESLGKAALKVIEENQGALHKSVDVIEQFLRHQ